jgi:transcriptional repressor NrdR
VRCPLCASVDDKVVDSRLAEDGAAIRRRRECLSCGRRFTTYERLDDVPLVVIKRSGHPESWDRAKIVAGLQAAAKNRPISEDQLEDLAARVEEEARLVGPEVPSERVGRWVLDLLRGVDEVAYLRFASVYMGFDAADDFAREADLLTKATAPKPRP